MQRSLRPSFSHAFVMLIVFEDQEPFRKAIVNNGVEFVIRYRVTLP